MSDPIDRDFGAPDDRTWTLLEFYDEITRQTVDSLEAATAVEAPALLGVLLDVARLRAAPTPQPGSVVQERGVADTHPQTLEEKP